MSEIGPYIPLNPFSSVHLFNTQNYATIGSFCLPLMQRGQIVTIVDTDGFLSVSNIQLYGVANGPASQRVEGLAMKTYNTNRLVRTLLFVGGNHQGNLICINSYISA